MQDTQCTDIQYVGHFGCSVCLYCIYSLRFWSLKDWRADSGAATAAARMSGCAVPAPGVLHWQLWGEHPRALTRDISYSPGSVVRATTALISCYTVQPLPFFLDHHFDKHPLSFVYRVLLFLFCCLASDTAGQGIHKYIALLLLPVAPWLFSCTCLARGAIGQD